METCSKLATQLRQSESKPTLLWTQGGLTVEYKSLTWLPQESDPHRNIHGGGKQLNLLCKA